MRCGRCGNENAEGNRFCGMCGAALVAKAQAAGPIAPAGKIAAPATRVEPSTKESAKVESKPEPMITGPSFLGLNTPSTASSAPGEFNADGHAGAGHDSLRPSSRNLDYLLEDEEEPKRRPGKVILLVVALALALGFGYLHWKQGGFDWLNAGDKKPAAATTSDAGQSSGDSGGTAGAAGTPNGATPPAGIATAPAAAGSAASPDSAAAPSTASQAAVPPGALAQPAPADSKPADSSAPPDATAPAAGTDSDKKAVPVEAPSARKKETRKPVAAKPAAGKPVDKVAEAERYIYGRGVGQDCDRGMRLLKAQQADTKAMISLGAIYSTGTCAPRDLPTAYRWFAMALHKDPDNQALQDDLQKLWGQMTGPERQLAIKLSQ